jgi:hypothetical protein
MAARRSPWLNDRTDLLLAELGEREMTLPEGVARQLISDHLDEVVTRMRIGRQAARYYVTDDVITELAAEVLGINKGTDPAHENVVSIVAERSRRRRR